ncbi:enoyl-CoA hydratase/isomerase family protein [Coraliomargarita sp. W4R72]
MDFISINKNAGVATITLNRGKVNAFNEAMVEQLQAAFIALQADAAVQAVILTGQGKFFSFGFDIPEFLPYTPQEFTHYLTKFTDLYRSIFLFPKPVLAALNGHTMAGGCMLAAACDWRGMVTGRAKIALNEITFGATVLAGATEILAYSTGSKNAQNILYSGRLWTAEQAHSLGLIDTVCEEAALTEATQVKAQALASQDPSAFASIKALLRQPIAERIRQREPASIQEFVQIWYSKSTQANLAKIKVKS